MTDFTESFRERDANDFTVPPDPDNMGLKEGKQYEMVVGRHPNEREVRGMKAGFKKPKFRKMSERDFIDKIGHCGPTGGAVECHVKFLGTSHVNFCS